MSSDGFKVPALPTAGPSSTAAKRKYAEDANGTHGSTSKRSRPTVEDDSDAVPAPSSKPKRTYNFAPSIPIKSAGSVTTDVNAKARDVDADDELDGRDGDRTFEADEGDEEGRFFGGGINETQEQILNMFAAAEDVTTSGLPTVQELRRQIIKFERIVQKNTEMRARFADDPSKYLESEADLDKAFTFFYTLTQDPLTFYPELSHHDTLISTLVNLLTHENTDISLQAIGVVYELTDEDVGQELVDEADRDDDENEEKREEVAKNVRFVMGELITALLDNSLVELLVPNLSRLNEREEESDRTGVFNILGIFENVLSFIPPLATQVVNTTELLPWLLKRIGNDWPFDSNKQYASEILSILLQEEREVRLKFVELKGLDTVLEAVAEYRKKDPETSEEVEYMENLFDALCSALAEQEAKKAFEEAEGVQLMVLIMKANQTASTRAIKVLDYACQTDSDEGKRSCEIFVEVAGLKALFAVLMGKAHKKSKKAPTATHSALEDEEHVLSILSSLFTTLDSDSVPRLRLLKKFVEHDYENVDRLVEMMEAAEGRLKAVNQEIELEQQVMQANNEEITEIETDEWYMRRMNAGLAHLQDICYCLAWLIMEDDGAQVHAKMLLERRARTFKEISAILKELREVIVSGIELPDAGADAKPDPEDPAVQKAVILDALTQFLDGI